MAVTIDATVGGATSNSFVTEEEAIAYMATRLNSSAWTTFSGTALTDEEKQALVEAQRELSVESWAGVRASESQALQWPRNWVYNPDSPNGFFYESTVIPQRVKDAQCELAFQFLVAEDEDLASLDPNIGIRVKTVDVLTTEWFEPFQRAQGLKRFPRVWNLIAPLVTGSSYMVRTLRG